LFEDLKTIEEKMISHMRCEICHNATNSLNFWFDKLLCRTCYTIDRSNQETILVSNLQDWNISFILKLFVVSLKLRLLVPTCWKKYPENQIKLQFNLWYAICSLYF